MEVDERRQIESAYATAMASMIRSLKQETLYFLEEQIALLHLAEPRRRDQIEFAARSEYRMLHKFFSSKTGASLVHALDMNHRRGAAWWWLTEALLRREIEVRWLLTVEHINWLDGTKTLWMAYRSNSSTAVIHGGPKVAQSPELTSLYRERRRGILAACVRELEFTHGVERSRIEWAEELDRQEMERKIG